MGLLTLRVVIVYIGIFGREAEGRVAMDIVRQLKHFLEPGSVAIIGASRRTGEDAFNVLENLLSYGYKGRIYPVNPNASEILGIRTYTQVKELPEKVDLAVVSLPRSLVPEIVRQCVDAGIPAITIVTQGFADADDDEGERLQEEIDGLIEGNGTRVLGPNTFGTANAYINFSSSFIRMRMETLPVGLICQTGAFFVGFCDIRSVGKAIDLGNACDIDLADGLEYYGQDPETKVIALHIEGVRDGRRFLRAADRVSGTKPIIALKTGRSGRAAQAVRSHTGSLTGRDEVWDVALKRAGVIRVTNIEEFSDAIRAFLTLPLMSGKNVGIATYTGGFGIMGVDACEKSGLDLAELSPVTIEKLSALSPSWLAVGNPVDMWPGIMISGHSVFEMEKAAIQNLLSDQQVNAVLCIFAANKPALHVELCQLVEEAAREHPEKPLVFYIYGSFFSEVKNGLEATGKTLVFSSFDRAMRSLGHLGSYSQFRLEH
ncbi:MAG: CoA-binding protein [Dehalococcoidia bacterium]|nr:CoA-binding protein [Dehalococcoidia bacterium]